MKAIVIGLRDADAGATALEIILRASVVYCGADVPNGPILDYGPDGNGLGIVIDLAQLGQYADRVEDALIARAAQLGLPVLARPDCVFPQYQRGA